jgi:hypothetical protein
MSGESPNATARFYSNGRNSYSCLVPCARRPSKMQAALLPCSVHFVRCFDRFFVAFVNAFLLWSLRVVKRSYKLSKPSGTPCSFRRKLRQLTKLLVRINLHRGYPTITQLVFWSSAERDSTILRGPPVLVGLSSLLRLLFKSPTWLECSVRSFCRRGGYSGVWVSKPRLLKLQKPVPMDLEPASHEPFPVVPHAPWNSKSPRRPDSVPCQYRASCPAKSTTYSSFPKLWLGVRSTVMMDSCASDGAFSLFLTQHSKTFLVFLTRMFPVCHHPSILNPQYSDPFVSLFESVHCVFSVLFVHWVPHICRFLRWKSEYSFNIPDPLYRLEDMSRRGEVVGLL